MNRFFGEIVVQVILILKLQDKAMRKAFIERFPRTILACVESMISNWLSTPSPLKFVVRHCSRLEQCCTHQLSDSWSMVCQSSDSAISSWEPWKTQSVSQSQTMWCRSGTWTAQYAWLFRPWWSIVDLSQCSNGRRPAEMANRTEQKAETEVTKPQEGKTPFKQTHTILFQDNPSLVPGKHIVSVIEMDKMYKELRYFFPCCIHNRK